MITSDIEKAAKNPEWQYCHSGFFKSAPGGFVIILL